MEFQVLLIVVVAFVATIQARPAANQCCFPDKLAGYEGISAGEMHDQTGLSIAAMYSFEWDKSLQKIALNGTIVINRAQTMYMTILQDYNKMIQYVVTGGKCQKQPIPLPLWGDNCIPANTKKTPSYYGIGNNKIMVDMYEPFKMGNFMLSWVVSQTPDSCAPVALHVETSAGFYDMGFTGLTTEIKDMKVFDIPKPCQQLMTMPDLKQKI